MPRSAGRLAMPVRRSTVAASCGRREGRPELGHRARKATVEAAALRRYGRCQLAAGEALRRAHDGDHAAPDPDGRDDGNQATAEQPGEEQRRRLELRDRKLAAREREDDEADEGNRRKQPEPGQGHGSPDHGTRRDPSNRPPRRYRPARRKSRPRLIGCLRSTAAATRRAGVQRPAGILRRSPTPWPVQPPEGASDCPRPPSRSGHEHGGPLLHGVQRRRTRRRGAGYPAGPRRARRGPFFLPVRFARDRRRAPGGWHAGHGDRRPPVGRRGQGQGNRLPFRAGALGRPLPGWGQRRPHDHARDGGVQAPPGPEWRALSAHHAADRAGGGGQPGDPDRRARRALRARDRHEPRPGLACLSRHHAVPRRRGSRVRGPPRTGRDRHHQPGDRAGLRRSGVQGRPPHGGSPRRGCAAPQARSPGPRQERLAGPSRGRGSPVRRRGARRSRRSAGASGCGS